MDALMGEFIHSLEIYSLPAVRHIPFRSLEYNMGETLSFRSLYSSLGRY